MSNVRIQYVFDDLKIGMTVDIDVDDIEKENMFMNVQSHLLLTIIQQSLVLCMDFQRQSAVKSEELKS